MALHVLGPVLMTELLLPAHRADRLISPLTRAG